MRSFVTALIFSISAPVMAFEYLQPLPDSPIIPDSNPQTSKKIQLGKQLFFDTRLSSDGSTSCNSCHNLAASGDSEGITAGMRAKGIKRDAPTLWNVGHMSAYFWEARSTSLESQAKEHLLDPRIMNMSNEENIIQRLSAIPGYQRSFKTVFPNKKVSMENVSKAIASFERTLNTPDSLFDQYIKGDKSKLNASAMRGVTIFTNKGCLACHFGVNFAGPAPGPGLGMGDGFWEMFPNYRGTQYEDKYGLVEDLGRYHVTLKEDHKVMWRVPSLRNVINTAPYFHNASVNDINEAVKIMSKVQFNNDITDAEVKDVVEFLKSLTGKYPEITLPRLPESAGANPIN